MNFAFFKEHPYGTAIGAAVVALIAYFLSRGSASTSTASSSGGQSLEEMQINAATNAQNAQLSAQTQAVQIQAGVANNQTAAQLQAIQLQTQAQIAEQATAAATQIALTQSNNDAATTQNADSLTAAYNMQKLNADVLTTQLTAGAATQQKQMDDILAAQINDNATQLEAVKTQYDYQTSVADLQAALTSQGIDASLQQGKDYASLAAAVAARAGQSYNTKADADRATALLSQILAGGNPSPVIANTYSSMNQNIANGAASIIKTIGGVTAPIITGLFA